MPRQGLFITFEGPEGSGKSTHSKLLCDFLRKEGYKALRTREPGGVVISEKIRKILLDPENKGMDVVCEMFLYMAARAQIVKEKILPSLKQGKVVICDRFMDATLAYQGYGAGLDTEIIKRIGDLSVKGVAPDVTFLLDIDVKKGLLRSGRKKDRIERRPLLYHRKVRQGYLELARSAPQRIKVIPAAGDVTETQEIIRKIAIKLCHSLK